MLGPLLLIPLCFVAGLLWGPWLIEKLRERKFGKQIRLEGQEHHLSKQGTPTMGGWLFVVTGSVAMALVVQQPRVVLPVAGGMLLFALFGAFDDYVNSKNREGLGFHVHTQIFWQLLIAAAMGAAMYWLFGVDRVDVPGLGRFAIGVLMVPFATAVVFSTATAVNILDGLDGLAGGTGAIGFAAFMAIALRGGDVPLAGVCAAMVGGLLAFLWFNVHPARVFMGGVGSLALGAGMAGVALLSGEVLLLPIVALPAVISLGSSMLQTGYYKLTKGRRIFKRAPFHHHLEMIGWPEVQIVFRYWIVAALCAAVAVALADL